MPKFTITSDKSYPEFLPGSFKNAIVNETKDRKMVSNNVVPRDPVYVAFGLGISNAEELTTNILDETSLIIYRERLIFFLKLS